MTFTDYLTALVIYIINDTRNYIAEINQDINAGFEGLNGRLAEEQAAEKKFAQLQIHLYESPTAAIEAIKQDETMLRDLWDHARDGFCDSHQSQKIAECDSQILAEGHKQLGALVAENCTYQD